MSEHNLVIPEADWRKLLASAKGDDALLYLYLRVGGQAEQAESALHMTRSRLECAEASLRSIGLWPEKPKVLRPAEPPAYTEADLIREMKEDTGFSQLLGETQRRLGKVLSTEELKILLSIYNYLGLPAEVISILISFCMQRAKAKKLRRPPSMRTIEKEAYHWADQGIETLEEAAAYVQLEMEKQTKLRAMQRALQINDRQLVRGEEAILRRWIDWGYGPGEIALAYERTCLQIGSFKWPYIESIVESWKKQGLYTAADIQAQDKGPAKPAAKPQEQQPNQWAKDAVARMMRAQEE